MCFCYDLYHQNLYIITARESQAGVPFVSAHFDFSESLRADLAKGEILPFTRFVYRGVLSAMIRLNSFIVCWATRIVQVG